MRFLASAFLSSLLALPLIFTTGASHAAVIAGSSNGNFSQAWGCAKPETCRITSNGGTNNVLEWGYTTGRNATAGSTLVAKQQSWNTTTNANDVILAELVWTNRATSSTITPDWFGAQYTLNVNFSNPEVSNDSEAFNLTIFNTENSTGDFLLGLTLADLSNLKFNLAGVEMSDVKYQLAAGTAGAFNSYYWANPEYKTSTLYITADFKAIELAPVDEEQHADVPEPASLALFAAGLFGMGFLRRRKH